MSHPQTDMTRHFIAALAFRFRHAVKGAPADFGDFQAGGEVRTPSVTVQHMTGLLLFVHHRFTPFELQKPPALPWDEEVERFLDVLALVDDDFAKEKPLRLGEQGLEQLLQGPLMDALTHIGQLATLRRLAGSPVPRVSYLSANIRIGKLNG